MTFGTPLVPLPEGVSRRDLEEHLAYLQAIGQGGTTAASNVRARLALLDAGYDAGGSYVLGGTPQAPTVWRMDAPTSTRSSSTSSTMSPLLWVAAAAAAFSFLRRR